MAAKPILIMDECPQDAECLGQHLAELGHASVVASSLSEAIAALQEHSYTAVLADLWMETGAGERLLRWVLAEGRCEPVLLMAEGADYDLMIDLVNKGAIDLLGKPPLVAQLQRSLDLALGEPAVLA